MLQKFLGFSEIAFHRLEWLLLASVVAYGLSQALLYFTQRQLIARRWTLGSPTASSPRSSAGGKIAKKYFSFSIFWLSQVISWKIVLPLLEMHPEHEAHCDDVLNVLLILASTWTATRIVSFAKLVLYSHLDVTTPNNLKERKIRTQVQFTEKMVLIFLYVIAAALVLMNFEGARRIGSSLIASAGLAGVVVGFAAQKSLGNLLAGFQIAFTQPIRIDDVVIVEGEWGRIEEIALTYVAVRIWDKRCLIVPITYFLEKPFQNWTRATADILGTVFLHMDYRIPIEPMRKEFERYVATSPLWDGQTCVLQVTDFTERTMELRLLVGARNASDAFDIRCHIREHMIGYIQSEFPQGLPQQRVLAVAKFEREAKYSHQEKDPEKDLTNSISRTGERPLPALN